MKDLVIIPTYNEKENICSILPALLEKYANLEILIVDDNSPDGTGGLVKEMQASEKRIHLLEREGKAGLGKAYLAGFQWAIEKGFERVIQMDADFSHRPEDLAKHLEALKENDVVVGSRWVRGGGTRNWGLFRYLISQGGSFYSRFILRYAVRDWTGGFNGWRVSVLKNLNLAGIQCEGYSFQIEMKYRALRQGYRLKEVPILFEDRRAGESKMSARIVFEALLKVWKIRFST